MTRNGSLIQSLRLPSVPVEIPPGHWELHRCRGIYRHCWNGLEVLTLASASAGLFPANVRGQRLGFLRTILAEAPRGAVLSSLPFGTVLDVAGQTIPPSPSSAD